MARALGFRSQVVRMTGERKQMPVPILKHKSWRVLWGNIRRLPRLIRRSGFRYFRHAMIRHPYQIYVKGGKAELYGPDSPLQREAYVSIILDDAYSIFDIYSKLKAAVIADIGANIGLFSRLCSLFFPQAEIFAYEPNPQTFEWLNRNCRGTLITPFESAVLDRGGHCLLKLNDCQSAVDPSGTVRVDVIGAKEVAQGRPIDLLKIDTEGSEWDILLEPSLLQRTKHCVMEYHIRNKSESIERLRELLEHGSHHIVKVKGCPKIGIVWSRHV